MQSARGRILTGVIARVPATRQENSNAFANIWPDGA